MDPRRVVFGLLALLTAVAIGVSSASAQFSIGFEAPDYESGPLRLAPERHAGLQAGQDDWYGFDGSPRIHTGSEISAALQAAGLNPANPVHTGDQALFMVNEFDDPQGGLWRRPFTGFETESRVVVEWWARPLTPGNGQPGTTIGQSINNTFVGIQDSNDSGDGGRAAAIRFGYWAVDGETLVRSIDFASHDAPASNPAGVWISSGIEWTEDAWYNFQLHLDYESKVYDFYVDGTKVNNAPITFYRATATHAEKFFISRGTNNAGQIIDDIDVYASPPGLQGDFNGDGVVDGNDFLVWQRDPSVGELADWKAGFGSGASQAVATAVVPEPSSVLLAAVMGAVLAGRRKRFG